MSILPDDLWRRILELGIKRGGFTYKDLCCISISCRLLHRLSGEEALWSHLLLSDFPSASSSSSPVKPKSLYRNRYERERERKIAAHRRAVLRKENEIAELSRKLRGMETGLAEEGENMRAILAELSNLGKVREASVALNAWQPEVVRGRHKQIVEQCAVPVEYRMHALEMELRLCKHRISGFRRGLKDEKPRLDTAKQQLLSLNYHPLRGDYAGFSWGGGGTIRVT
ncbi:hypothetical protein FH972_019872 [Carpinus fangiana]|uniref:F-box domain-containing protein n=1 Tax=Carpinus fangiana TaxID=176857 RepID=A0A5N6RRR5_9ROSI|nr:hypothetical protein FH972_019872 [Carpinus fangiana]